jgi:hypothetical protein
MTLRPDPTRASAFAAVCADLYHIGCELTRRRLHLCLHGGALAVRAAGKTRAPAEPVPESVRDIVTLHARRLRRYVLLIPPDELPRLLCALFAPLPERFELHPGVTVTDSTQWRKAMVYAVEQGPDGPRYQSGALGRDLDALERVVSAHAQAGVLARRSTTAAPRAA